MNNASTEYPGHGENRVVLVTGATRGVGEAAVRRLALGGHSVIVNYTHEQRLADQVVDSILAEGGAALAVRADVSDEVDVERLFAETIEWCGGVDAVVHAVIGDIPHGPLAETSVEQIEALTRLRARATLLVNREAARHVRAHGAIVNFSSSLARRRVPGFAAHSASEAATDVLTRTLAEELRDRGVTVNAIALDFDRPCEPHQIAEIVEYLVSKEAHSLTGEVITLEQWRRDPRRNGDGPPRQPDSQ